LQDAVTAFRHGPGQRGRLQTSLDGYFKAVESELLAPLLAQGINCRSSIRCNLHLAAAEVCRLIYRESYWAHAAAELLQAKRDAQDRRPQNLLRAVSALTHIAARLLA
jgi:hypothetical protein